MKQIQIKIVIIFCFIVMFSSLEAQKNRKPRPGFLLSTATIQYGIPTSSLVSPTWYLTMRAEAFIEKNISLAGRLDVSLPKKNNYDDLLENHALYFGANYHLLVKYFDAYIGFQPGVSLSKTTLADYDLLDKTKYFVSPLVSSTIGARYYLGSVFNVFGSVTYSYGVLLSNQTNLPLSEFKIAGGLGLNLNIIKEKK